MSLLLAAALLAAPAGAAPLPRGATEPYSLPAPTTAQAIEYESEHFDYDREMARLHLLGDVRVWDSTWTIRAKELWLDMDTRVGRALGPLRLEDALNRVEGDAGTFNFATREGQVDGGKAYYPPWRIHGERAQVDRRRELWYRGATFTSCSEGPLGEPGGRGPHYRFEATQVHVKPKRYLLARNVVFYLGRAPVFYTPVLWKSLRPRHILRTRFNPGYDRRNGPFVRTNTLYSFHPAMQGRLFLDYFSHPGVGVGNELQYFGSEAGKGALYAYRVHERTSGRERWAALGDHYQAFGSTWAAQARLQAQSDPAFHNDYTRANAFRVTQQLVNGAAFVRTTGRTTTRLAYSRIDNGDSARPARFLKDTESSPRLDFLTAPLGLGRLPVLHVLRAFADNSYDASRGFQQKAVGGGWEGTQTLRLARGVSLSPRAALSEAFEDRRQAPTEFGSTETLKDVFVGRWELGGTLRVANPLGDTDLTHAFRRRLKPDTLQEDVGAPDYGVEANLLSLGHGLRPARAVYVHLDAGYDFRTFRGRGVGFRERVQPFAADVSVALPRAWTLLVHEDYQLREGNRTTLVAADWGGPEGSYLRFGLANARPQEQHYFLSQEAGWGPADGSWQLAGALRADLRTSGGARFDAVQLFEKEVSLRKDFHDFHTQVVFRSRPGGVQEVHARVNLKVEPRDIWRRRVYTDYTGR